MLMLLLKNSRRFVIKFGLISGMGERLMLVLKLFRRFILQLSRPAGKEKNIDVTA